MHSKTIRRIVLAAGAAVFVALLGLAVVHNLPRSQVRTIRGTITRIDVENRTATITYLHPRTGQNREIPGIVPEHCEISIDGESAELSELRVGEQAEVEGTLRPNMPITANWVRVTRAPTATSRGATSQPTTAP